MGVTHVVSAARGSSLGSGLTLDRSWHLLLLLCSLILGQRGRWNRASSPGRRPSIVGLKVRRPSSGQSSRGLQGTYPSRLPGHLFAAHSPLIAPEASWRVLLHPEDTGKGVSKGWPAASHSSLTLSSPPQGEARALSRALGLVMGPMPPAHPTLSHAGLHAPPAPSCVCL